MNRKERRHTNKIHARAKYSLQDVQSAFNIAIAMKKLNKGHLFNKNMKDRCVFCGVTTKTKKQCDYWFMSFLDRVQTILINPSFFTDDNLQALWLQHGEAYQNIKLPMNVTDEKN